MRGSPKLNVRCDISYERLIGLFFLNCYLVNCLTLENFAFPQQQVLQPNFICSEMVKLFDHTGSNLINSSFTTLSLSPWSLCGISSLMKCDKEFFLVRKPNWLSFRQQWKLCWHFQMKLISWKTEEFCVSYHSLNIVWAYY